MILKADKYGLSSKTVVQVSQELDQLINEYQKKMKGKDNMDKNSNSTNWVNKQFPEGEAVQVNEEQAEHIIEFHEPIGNFYLENGNIFIGIDNSTGDSFIEEFSDKETCIAWLTDKSITYFTELDYGKSLNELNKIECCHSEFEAIIAQKGRNNDK